MNTVFFARYDSRNFSFEGFGATEAEALQALHKGLKRHGKEYGCAPGWFYPEDIFVREIRLGAVYRDRDLMIGE